MCSRPAITLAQVQWSDALSRAGVQWTLFTIDYTLLTILTMISRLFWMLHKVDCDLHRSNTPNKFKNLKFRYLQIRKAPIGLWWISRCLNEAYLEQTFYILRPSRNWRSLRHSLESLQILAVQSLNPKQIQQFTRADLAEPVSPAIKSARRFTGS